MGVFIDRDLLVATFTASDFAMIDPDACYTGVCTQAESFHQNCVLGRCVSLCSVVVLHLPSFFL